MEGSRSKLVGVLAFAGLAAAAGAVLLVTCARDPNAKFAALRNGMTRAEVLALVGEPESRTLQICPDQFFVGAPAPYNSTMLNPQKEYEEWRYVLRGDRHEIWFSHPTLPRDRWVKIGGASHERGKPL